MLVLKNIGNKKYGPHFRYNQNSTFSNNLRHVDGPYDHHKCLLNMRYLYYYCIKSTSMIYTKLLYTQYTVYIFCHFYLQKCYWQNIVKIKKNILFISILLQNQNIQFWISESAHTVWLIRYEHFHTHSHTVWVIRSS